jgi:hypothetical protein
MTMSFRRYVAIDAIALAALNASMNGAYTWLLWHARSDLTLNGEGGIAVDLAGTPVWIAVLATLLGTSAVRRKLWEGRVATPREAVPTIFSLLPFNVAGRAAAMSTFATIIFALPLWSALHTAHSGNLSIEFAVIAKVTITIVLTLVIVPLVILAALRDMQPKRKAPARSGVRSS